MSQPKEILVPAGKFHMGRDNGPPEEGPAHVVEVSAFYMDVCPVSNREFARFCSETGQPLPDSHFFGALKDPVQPVTLVSWYQAQAYAEWVGKLLPSEAQWEYAARFGEGETPLAGGDSGRDLKVPLPVGGGSPNALGLFDLGCNVWEWTNDWFAADFYRRSPRQDPAGPDSGAAKTIRGGEWFDYGQDRPLTQRGHLIPPNNHELVGFRLVRSA